MIQKKKFALLGGDKRTVAAGKILLKNGFDIRLFGFEKYEEDLGEIKKANALEEALSGAEFILLPLPVFSETGILNTPFGSEKIKFENILNNAEKNAVIFGGNIPEEMKKNGFVFEDYLNRDDFQIKNAVPTAEGALAHAILNTGKTVDKSRCLVIGFGRIGKLLSLKLKALGADVTVSARKSGDLSMIAALGMIPYETEEISEIIGEQDVIFNTVPKLVIGEKELSGIKSSAFLADLASKPGGIDFKAAEKKGIKAEWLLSLPGKTAPETAGEIIAETIIRITEGGRENG